MGAFVLAELDGLAGGPGRQLVERVIASGALGLEFGTLRQVLEILKRVYGQHIGTEYMHISDPEQRQWIQDRLEGPDDIRFTPQGKKAILKKLIEAGKYRAVIDRRYPLEDVVEEVNLRHIEFGAAPASQLVAEAKFTASFESGLALK